MHPEKIHHIYNQANRTENLFIAIEAPLCVHTRVKDQPGLETFFGKFETFQKLG
jgi:hypothetical protein